MEKENISADHRDNSKKWISFYKKTPQIFGVSSCQYLPLFDSFPARSLLVTNVGSYMKC